MKTEKVSVNRTKEAPNGVEIEIIKPENELEARAMAFLLGSFVREAKTAGRIPYEMSTKARVQHQADGTFIAVGATQDQFYEPDRALAIVGLRAAGPTFDLIHAQITPEMLKAAAEAAKTAAPKA